VSNDPSRFIYLLKQRNVCHNFTITEFRTYF